MPGVYTTAGRRWKALEGAGMKVRWGDISLTVRRKSLFRK